jgi:hypothetical protein
MPGAAIILGAAKHFDIIINFKGVIAMEAVLKAGSNPVRWEIPYSLLPECHRQRRFKVSI